MAEHASQEQLSAVTVVPASGKGGSGKSFLLFHLAAEASARGKKVYLADGDPEANLTRRMAEQGNVNPDAPGVGDALFAAGLGGNKLDPEAGAEVLTNSVQATSWPGVYMIPAGRLQAVAQATSADTDDLWLLHDMIELTDLRDESDIFGFDTAGRHGHLVNMALYAADVAFVPVHNSADAITKASEAMARIERINTGDKQIRFGGGVLSGFDKRSATAQVLYEEAKDLFEHRPHFTVPYRPGIYHAAYTDGQRLVDLPDRTPREIRDARKPWTTMLYTGVLQLPVPDGNAQVAA